MCKGEEIEKDGDRTRAKSESVFSTVTQGGLHGGGLPNCIAYAKGSLDNRDSQRAERVVIRNMG